MVSRLRERLQEITQILDVALHPSLIEELRSEIAHSITIRNSTVPTNRYTCAVYAFDLVEDPAYVEIAEFGIGSTFAGKDFIRYVIDNDFLKDDSDGDLAIYFANGEFEHIGKVESLNRITSKWGCGCLLEHDVWEVPSSYGSEVRRFVIAPPKNGLDLFVAYAQSRGIEFEPVDA